MDSAESSPRPQYQGPAGVDLSDQTPTTAPETEDSGPGQAAYGQDSVSAQSPQTTGEERFTDLDETILSGPELARLKQMQADYTRKTQSLAAQRREIEAVQAMARVAQNFQQAPYSPDIQQYLRQYGYVLANQQGGAQEQQQWEPQTWDDVRNTIKAEARQEVLRDLAPIMGNVQQMQARAVEAELNRIDPQWREYEPQMMSILQQIPSLAHHPAHLYRLAVPPEVIEAKAVKQAIGKLESKGKHVAVESRTSAPRSAPKAKKPTSFEEAYALAVHQINQGE